MKVWRCQERQLQQEVSGGGAGLSDDKIQDEALLVGGDVTRRRSACQAAGRTDGRWGFSGQLAFSHPG